LLSANQGKGVIILRENANWNAKWTIYKYKGKPDPENLYAVEEIDGNLLLKSGANAIWRLVIGDGTVTPFSYPNVYLGVGDGSVAEHANQTGLQGGAKVYAMVINGYPQIVDNTITFIASFADNQANFAWNEFSVRNASNELSGVSLNRKVETGRTKVAGDSWILKLDITLQ
jgi:hypothetical protein